jgi:hypothetical protein
MWMSIQTDATSIAVVGAAASPGTPTSNQTFNGVLDSVPYNPGSGLADGYVVPYGNNGANGFNYVNIDWGDGTTSGAQLVANNLGDLDVTGSHAYAAIGFYNVTVTGQSYFSAPALDYNGGGNTGKLNFVVTVVVTSSSVYIQNPPLPDQTVYPAVVPTAAAASSPQIAAVNVSAKSTPSLFSVTPIGVAVDGLFNSDAGSSPLDNSGM